MCLAQGPQRSDAGEVRTRGPSVSSQALYHWATALPEHMGEKLKISKILNFWNSNFKTCRMSTNMDNLKLKWLIVVR